VGLTERLRLRLCTTSTVGPSGRDLSGYRWGLERKRALLKRESREQAD